MNTPAQLAKHIRDVHFGGNWTLVSLKQTLSDVTWQESITQVHSFNTIATLTFHINYFITAVIPVLKGQPLDAHDKYSFDHPPIHSPHAWETFLDKIWKDAETFASLVEQLHESKLEEDFSDNKYGTYYRNILGIIEHSHYHLGQISLIKKLLREQE
jgi:hypothetical protein